MNLIALTILLLAQSCSEEIEEPVSRIGHLKIYVTVPEIVRDENGEMVGLAPSPAEGVTTRLYQSDARCLGYKDAGFGFAYTQTSPVLSKYAWKSDENGIVKLYNIQSGKYYLTLFSTYTRRYSEKVIEITVGDTLTLYKDFTSLANYFEALEPWDEPYPEFPN